MFGNWLKTSMLMAAIVALFGAIGAMLGGASGMLLALLVGGGLQSLFSTHPATEERIARLLAMGRGFA